MSWLSHNPHDIYDHLIVLLRNGIRPFSKSVSVLGSTESAILQEAYRHGQPIPHRQDTLEGLWITNLPVPPQRSSGTWLMTSHDSATIFHDSFYSIFRLYITGHWASRGIVLRHLSIAQRWFIFPWPHFFIVLADSFVLTTHYYSAIFISIHTLPFILSLLVYVSLFGNIGIILQETHQGHFFYIYL